MSLAVGIPVVALAIRYHSQISHFVVSLWSESSFLSTLGEPTFITHITPFFPSERVAAIRTPITRFDHGNAVHSLTVLQDKDTAKPYCACTVPATPCRLPRKRPIVLRSGSRLYVSRGSLLPPTSLYPLRFMQSSTNLYS